MSRLRLVLLLATLALFVTGTGSAPGGQRSDGMVSVVVVLREQADLAAIGGSRTARHRETVEALQKTAERTQKLLRALLELRRSQAKVAEVHPFWVFNGIAVRATGDVIQELAARPEVARITLDEAISPPPPVTAAVSSEANVALVNAPALWNLGIRGQGIVVANMDTGVDINHPELAARWRGGTNSWFDPSGQNPTTPTDVNGHGTATMGVMVGGDAGGSSIGIAPDAQWIAVKLFNNQGQATTTWAHAGYQWLLDPDGNPSTPDAPHVVNNSWSLGGPGCNLEFQLDFQSLRAAGTLPVFAAGNYGPGSSSSPSPANNSGAFAVGATTNADAIASFSSRGPSACGEPTTTFPELVAPGVGIRSTDLFGLYAPQTGTSFAAPHVAGAVALLLDAFPALTVDEQEAALKAGAVDLGPPGPDNDFGQGRLDILASHDWLASAPPGFAVQASPTSRSTAPGGTVDYTVTVVPANGFTGDVDLSLSGLSPSAGSWSFSPSTVLGGSGSSQLTITTASSIAPGSYPLTITGTSGTLTQTTSVTLVVTPPGDFAVSVAPTSRTVTRGGQTTYTVYVSTQGGFSGTVTLSGSGLPAGATGSFSPSSGVPPGSSTLRVKTKTSTPRGTFTLTIYCTSGTTVRQTTATLTVR